MADLNDRDYHFHGLRLIDDRCFMKITFDDEPSPRPQHLVFSKSIHKIYEDKLELCSLLFDPVSPEAKTFALQLTMEDIKNHTNAHEEMLND